MAIKYSLFYCVVKQKVVCKCVCGWLWGEENKQATNVYDMCLLKLLFLFLLVA